MRKLLLRVFLVLAVAVSGLLVFASWRSRPYDMMALTEMNLIKNGLDYWKLTHGRYPTAVEGLRVLSDEPIMPSVPRDPWDREFAYDVGTEWMVRTVGEDGVYGTDDDLRLGEKPRKAWMNPFMLY